MCGAVCLVITSMLARTEVNRLSTEGRTLYNLITDQFSSLKKEILELSKVKHEISELLKIKEAELAEMKKTNDDLKTEVTRLNHALDHADQYERKDSIILSGPALKAPEDDEDTYAAVQKLLQDHFNMEIEQRDINVTHRLGPIKPGSKLRNIYVKFVRRADKIKVIQASKSLNKAPVGGSQQSRIKLYANESLTPTRRKIFSALRRMKADAPTLVKGCTTRDGRILAFTPPAPGQTRDRKHAITTLDELKDFCREFVKKPVDSFLQQPTSS